MTNINKRWVVKETKFTDSKSIYNVWNDETGTFIQAKNKEAAERMCECLNNDSVD
jgi:hypothetical protein